MAFIQRLPKSTLYILRGVTIGSTAGLAYLYFANRAKEGASLASVPVAQMGKEVPVSSLGAQGRASFMKKVYGTVGLQICAVTLSTILVLRRPAAYRRVLSPVVLVAFAGGLGSIVAMHTRTVRNNENYKKICLGIFTLAEMALIPAICLPYPREVVISALFNTSLVTGGLTAYAHTTKRDFTPYHGLLSAMLFGFVGISIISLFFPAHIPQHILAWGGAGLFSMLLVHDTQRFFKPGSKFRYGDYDIAAVNIYLDIINLFLQILQIMGESDKKRG